MSTTNPLDPSIADIGADIVFRRFGPISDIDRRPKLDVYRRNSIPILVGVAIAFHPF